MLVIKLRDWNNRRDDDTTMDSLHRIIQNLMRRVFNLSIPLLTATTRNIVYNMVNDLSSTVLNKAINKVDSLIKDDNDEQIKEWTNDVLGEGVSLPPAEFDVINRSLLNNFYKMYMQNEVDRLDSRSLKEKYKVNGYTRYVKFVDDTISEGRAKSPDPKEPLLDTSIYYDIKARLDQAKQIKMSTIYWIDAPGYESLGTTFYTDRQERFKFVVLVNFFNKEICDYVLRQIDKYRPTT